MDSLFREFVSSKIEASPLDTVYSLDDHIYMMRDYLSGHYTDGYILKDSTELSEYLCDNWICGHYLRYSPHNMDESRFELVNVRFYDTGRLSAVIMHSNGNLSEEEKSWVKSWSVDQDGRIDCFIGLSSTYVYVLTEDVFICEGFLFVRQK